MASSIEDTKEINNAVADMVHITTVDNVSAANKMLKGNTTHILILQLTSINNNDYKDVVQLIQSSRKADEKLFILIFSDSISQNAEKRWNFSHLGANMVSSSLKDTVTVITKICKNNNSGSYTCPYCEMTGLDEDTLWEHCPLFHIGAKTSKHPRCPICKEKTNDDHPMQVHIRNAHGPPQRGEMISEFKGKAPSIYVFSLVVVQRSDKKFLLVQEFASSGFWLPGGRADACEQLVIAAVRETKEEAGIDIQITGVLRFEYSPKEKYVRLRLIFYGIPLDEKQLPKSIPDYESEGAVWVSIEEMKSLPLRGSEPAEWFPYIMEGGPVYPVSIISDEHQRVRLPTSSIFSVTSSSTSSSSSSSSSSSFSK